MIAPSQPAPNSNGSIRAARIGLDGRYLDAHHPGIGRYVFELARALPAALSALPDAPRLSLLVTANDPGRFDRSRLTEAGVDLVPTSEKATVLPTRILDNEPLDCALWHAPYFATSLGSPRPRVVTVYDTIALVDPGFLGPGLRGRLRQLAYRALLAAAIARATTIVTLSEAAADDLARYVRFAGQTLDRARMAITPAGVDPRFRPASAETNAEFCRRLDLPDRFVLYLGTDRPHKNLDRLCQAWRDARARVAGRDPASEWHLVLAGFPRPSGGARDDESAGIRSLGTIAENDLPTLLSAADVFVSPSLIEGFGLPLLEAMACGTPVACAAGGSLEEVGGEAAACFHPEDLQAIADTLVHLMLDTEVRRSRGEAARDRAARFTWARTAEKTAAVYAQTIEKTRRR